MRSDCSKLLAMICIWGPFGLEVRLYTADPHSKDAFLPIRYWLCFYQVKEMKRGFHRTLKAFLDLSLPKSIISY